MAVRETTRPARPPATSQRITPWAASGRRSPRFPVSNAPFRPKLLPTALPWARHKEPALEEYLCCERDMAGVPIGDPPSATLGSRARLTELDQHLHCSVIGTCLTTGELRKLMGRFMDVQGASDLAVHHDAVRLTSTDAEVGKALNKALERRHEGAVLRFAKARDETALAELWREALRSGEIPGAYWALLTHRRTTTDLRQQAFGDVHMLSHLVGAANRADIRRLMALEREADDLRDRLERSTTRNAELVAERDHALADRDQAVIAAVAQRESPKPASATEVDLESLTAAVAVQTQRREAAESGADAARREAQRLTLEADRLRAMLSELSRELSAAENLLHESADTDGGAKSESRLRQAIRGKHILYVGGRPSSTQAIRAIVERCDAEFRKHDGGLEDRKGLLAPALAWADLVVFPVDCIDHDSALALKRDCSRQGRPYHVLRSASVASFIAAMVAEPDGSANTAIGGNGLCLRHA